MNLTTKGFKKPLATEDYDIGIHNDNSDLADSLITSIEGLGRTTETVKGNAGDITNLAGAGRTTETVKGNNTLIGVITGLFTTAKNNLVAAINELFTSLNAHKADNVSQLALKADKAQEAVIAPTLLNSWVNKGGTYSLAGYWKDSFGNVNIRGVVGSGQLSNVVFNLPVGYRPLLAQQFAVDADNGTTPYGVGKIEVRSDGNVVVFAASNSFLSLNLSFRI